MNENILECAQEAGLQPFEDCGPGYVAKMEKFAKLIVKKCAKVAAEHFDDCEGVDYGVEEVCYKYFGVE